MRRLISRLIADERGATAIEYGMICALIFVVALGAMTSFGNATTNMFITAANSIDGALK